MDIYEESVLNYITRGERGSSRFVHPQYNLEWKEEQGGSLPDFVVLDFEDKTIYIIEVSHAYDLSGLIKKVEDRTNRWTAPIKNKVSTFKYGETLYGWNSHITLFVRENRVDSLKNKFKVDDVSVISLKITDQFLGDGEFKISELNHRKLKEIKLKSK